MKISTILDHIDDKTISLPEFQRGYVWNRGHVRELFASLYRRHPVGGLLFWSTESKTTPHRGDPQSTKDTITLLLDGQQRITSIYGVARGEKPPFFDGNEQAFKGLYFHLENEIFEFYQPIKMRDDPLWIDVTNLIKNGNPAHTELINNLSKHPNIGVDKALGYTPKISNMLGILDIRIHVEEITGKDKTIDIVVDIFNQVNSSGKKLSKGDLALAKICATWPDGRNTMISKINQWKEHGYEFNHDWLLRSMNTILTGEAKFHYLHEKTSDEIQDGLKRAIKRIDKCLNLISGRLGLDHDRVFFGRAGVAVITRYLDQCNESIDEKERDKLLFWFAHAAMWGRFSGSTETVIDRDLEAIALPDGNLDKLLEQLRLWRGGALRVEAENFESTGTNSRFYSVLYMLTRMGEAVDWGTGLPLKANLVGKMNRLEKHHIFPKSLLKGKFLPRKINALANFCFQTKGTNLNISNDLPEEYLPKIEEKYPGALASQWIPEDPSLWKIENYSDFLKARKALLADKMNLIMKELLHGDDRWIQGEGQPADRYSAIDIPDEDEEIMVDKLNQWVEEQGLPRGHSPYDFADPKNGEQMMLDIAWPEGLQEGMSQPVAIILNGEAPAIALASQSGFRCFTEINKFRQYVKEEILANDGND